MNKEIEIRISHYINSTTALGPGKRFVLWMQGCEKKCSRCINPQGQRKTGGILYTKDSMLDIIKKQKNINGVTISGGEPFLQYDSLCALISQIRKETCLDVMVYTGYYLHELIEKYGNDIFNYCLCNIDILIDGPYIEKLDMGSMYRGSDNQEIYCFTGRYDSFLNKIKEAKNRDIEFIIDNNSDTYMVGIPEKKFFEKYISKMGEVSYDRKKIYISE